MIGCAPAEILFRQRTSYIGRLNNHARKNLTIRVAQEDPTQDPIHTLIPSPPAAASVPRIDIGICSVTNSQVTMCISKGWLGNQSTNNPTYSKLSNL